MRSPRILRFTLCVICGEKAYYNSKTCSEKCKKKRYALKEMNRLKRKRLKEVQIVNSDSDDEYLLEWQTLNKQQIHE
jgi:predicted nucleic acid-binding Zn ribbon protein